MWQFIGWAPACTHVSLLTLNILLNMPPAAEHCTCLAPTQWSTNHQSFIINTDHAPHGNPSLNPSTCNQRGSALRQAQSRSQFALIQGTICLTEVKTPVRVLLIHIHQPRSEKLLPVCGVCIQLRATADGISPTYRQPSSLPRSHCVRIRACCAMASVSPNCHCLCVPPHRQAALKEEVDRQGKVSMVDGPVLATSPERV